MWINAHDAKNEGDRAKKGASPFFVIGEGFCRFVRADFRIRPERFELRAVERRKDRQSSQRVTYRAVRLPGFPVPKFLSLLGHDKGDELTRDVGIGRNAKHGNRIDTKTRSAEHI